MYLPECIIVMKNGFRNISTIKKMWSDAMVPMLPCMALLGDKVSRPGPQPKGPSISVALA